MPSITSTSTSTSYLWAIAQRGNSGKLFSFEQFERRAAAGGDESHFVREPRLFHSRNRIAAANDRRRFRAGQRFCDRDRSRRERRNLKNAHRTIPQNRLRLRDFVFVEGDRRVADI